MEGKQLKLVLIAALIILLFGLSNTVKKESVASVEGQPCVRDKHCPCWGEYKVEQRGGTIPVDNATTYGLGVGQCIDCGLAKYTNRTACEKVGHVSGMVCDMTWCLDIQPTGEWLRENPWEWMMENSVITSAILLVIVGLLLYPKH